MGDRYASFANSGPGRTLVRRLGLPDPPRLRRHVPGDPLTPGPVLLGAAPGGRLADPIRKLVDVTDATSSAAGGARSGASEAGPGGASATGSGADSETGPGAGPSAAAGGARHGGLLFDATGITGTGGLRALYDFFHPHARTLLPSGRVVVFGTPPEDCATPGEATAQRAVEGLVRSIGKEFGRGVTAQLVHVARGGEEAIESTLRFLLSGRSAYVSGQVLRVGAGAVTAPRDPDRPLDGRVALVTGAARGIGAAVARVLARDGADVVVLDVPAAGDALAAVANEVRGRALQLDLTAPDAPHRLAASLTRGVDVVVHNAGVTRDRTIARMDAGAWDTVLGVNLAAPERVTAALLERGVLRDGGRIVAVASISGIAGNRGQTNYATSKAGVIGLVQATAPLVADRGITVNAVAPGFIETAMTARMPVLLREAGRRMNSLAQGGLPVDVAETIAWLAAPGSGTITGSVVRVCGQSVLGA